MLRIRQAQMRVLGDRMRRDFERRMVEHLRTRFDKELRELDEPALRAFVRDGIESARQYGVTSEDDVRRYLECMAQHGAHFDAAPATAWAGRILRTEGLDGSQKMDRIEDYETFVLREPR